MQSETRSDSRLFSELLRSLLGEGISVRFRAQGRSMYPAIADGDVVQVNPPAGPAVRGEVVMVESSEGLRVHRVIRSGENMRTRGDCCFQSDDNVQSVIGAASLAKGEISRPTPRQSLGTTIRRWIARWRGHF